MVVSSSRGITYQQKQNVIDYVSDGFQIVEKCEATSTDVQQARKLLADKTEEAKEREASQPLYEKVPNLWKNDS